MSSYLQIQSMKKKIKPLDIPPSIPEDKEWEIIVEKTRKLLKVEDEFMEKGRMLLKRKEELFKQIEEESRENRKQIDQIRKDLEDFFARQKELSSDPIKRINKLRSEYESKRGFSTYSKMEETKKCECCTISDGKKRKSKKRKSKKRKSKK